MPLQRHPDGPIYRRTVATDGTGDGVMVNSVPEADCCCESPPPVIWHALFPCSLELPLVGDSQCCPGDPHDCLWISQERYCQILQDAVDAGFIPAICVIGTAPACDVTIDPADGCDVTVPTYLSLFDFETQACYRLYLWAPGGMGTAFGTFCFYDSSGATPTTPPYGEDASDAVVLIGTSCCDFPCPCESGTPLPPIDPPGVPDPGECCTGAKTTATGVLSVTACVCTDGFCLAPFDVSEAVGISVRLRKGTAVDGTLGGCAYYGFYKTTIYNCGSCARTTSEEAIVGVQGSASDTGWIGLAYLYRRDPFTNQWTNSPTGSLAHANGARAGNCVSGSPVNVDTACGSIIYGYNGSINFSMS